MTGSGCNLTTRSAGVDRLVFAPCDVAFTVMTDLEEWEALVTAGDIVFSGQILGQKPKGTSTKKKLASCIPERVTSVTRQLQFTDANADNDDFTDYDFWNDKSQYSDAMVFGYLTCEEYFYGFFNRWSLEIDDTRTENSEDEFKWDGTLQYLELTARKPIKLTGISALIGAEVES